jgi:hypothetical protein
MSVLGGEYIKIGYTAQCVGKRKAALQTGNPYEIETIFTIDGTLKQEKEIHRSLTEVFDRLKVFNNPVNEWYPGENPIIKMFICNVRNFGINYAVRNINSIFHWETDVKEDEVFTVRNLEKALCSRGLSRKQAKILISQNKSELMGSCGDMRQRGSE